MSLMNSNPHNTLTFIMDPTNSIDNFLNITVQTTNDKNTLKKIISNPKALNIFAMNIRSLNKNFDNLLVLLTDLGNEFDVIVLSECWINANYIPKIINNYSVYNTTRHSSQSDGVIVYVKSYLNPIVSETSLDHANCLKVTIDNLNFFAIYRSPKSNNVSSFLYSLEKNIVDTTKDLIIIGDINIDILNEASPHTSKYLNLMGLHGLIPYINLPTRVTPTTKTCIDHIMVRTKRTAKSIIFESTVTDHYSTILELHNLKSPPPKSSNPVHNIVNMDLLLKSVECEKWESTMLSENVNTALEMFSASLTAHINHASFPTKTASNKKKKLKPWITNGLIFCIRKRDRLHKQALNNPDPQFLRFYKKYRNICNNLIIITKQKYYKKKIEDSGYDSKVIWNVVNDISENKKTSLNIQSLVINGKNIQVHEDPKTLADHANHYFSNIGTNLANKILKTTNKTQNLLTSRIRQQNSLHPTLILAPTSTKEIFDTIISIKTNSAAGIDKISPCILKHIAHFITTPLKHIVNLSFNSGSFPNQLKHATVIPIYKSGDKTNIENYRPISLLSVLSKIIEKIVKSRLISHLETQKILSPNQFGFQKKISTESAILDLTENITNSLNDGDSCLAIFLDLAKAFDTVSHPILLERLSQIGIRDSTLNWFSSYLTGRSQTVKINNMALSNPLPIQFGVPQGSVLGPILFLIYINKLCNLPINGKLISFADDTVLIARHKNWKGAFDIAQYDIGLVKNWLDDNLLTLNAGKTKFLTFSLSTANQPTNNQKITIHSCPRPYSSCTCPNLEKVSHIKYLGVLIDHHLRWDQHLASLTPRIRKLSYVFRTLRNILTPTVLKSVYYALCQSQLAYGIIIWGGCAHKFIDPLQKAQKTIIRAINKRPTRYSSNRLFTEYNVLNIRQLHLKFTLMHFKFKYKKKTLLHHNYTTRTITNRHYNLPTLHTTSARRHFMYLAPKIFNLLPENLKTETQPHTFKKQLSQWILTFRNYDLT